MKHLILMALFFIFLPGQARTQELVIAPSSSHLITDAEGRGTALLEFDVCEATLDGKVVTALLEWEPENINVSEYSEYWVHILAPETAVESGAAAWELLTDSPTAMWDINPSDLERDAAKKIRIILPGIASAVRQETQCTVTVLIGSSSVARENMALGTVQLRVHTVPGARVSRD